MTFVDTNIIIDILTRDSCWFDWSVTKLSQAATDGGAMTSVVVAAELARHYESSDDLTAKLSAMSVEVLPLQLDAAFRAGKSFGAYRAAGNREERRVLPDFFIGAHALSLAVPLLTRDPRLYKTYFPDLTLITPETHP